MDVTAPTSAELAAALLQGTIAGGLALLCFHLFGRYRKPYFAWWAGSWGLYVLRVGMIVSFLLTADRIWLYWHQVVTGWTALGLLAASLVFSRQLRWRPAYTLVFLFPALWSYVAIYRLDDFLLAAGPAVLFLSLATLWTGWVFLRHHRRVGSTGAAILAGALLLWGLHHLDYPFLRARGAWVPWGYYLDVLFLLATGTGIVLLVLDDLTRGVGALAAVSGDLQRGAAHDEVLDLLLDRPLTLPGVRGSALYLEAERRFVRGAGACAAWTGTTPAGEPAASLAQALVTGRPRVRGDWPDVHGETVYAFGAVLPVLRGETAIGALVLVGDTRDPFTALDDRFLVALGQQVGVALETAELTRRLADRTVELERLSQRMVAQHEEERRRLSRELHDESAQVFSAVKMELGILRSRLEPPLTSRLDRALTLVDAGIRSIRAVVNDLRPSLLDDLGLLPALRSLVADYTARSGLAITLDTPDTLPPLSTEAELALFRALQEALANVLRHAGATRVDVRLAVEEERLRLEITDDGRGLPPGVDPVRFEIEGHMGIAGMRERIGALGGRVSVHAGEPRGLRLMIEMPVSSEVAA